MEQGESHDPSQASKAIEEAASVLEAIGGGSHLDGFNLLGVIANPRGVPLTPSSFHGRYNTSASSTSSPSAASAAPPAHAPSSSSDMLTDTYHSIEMTLSQVTEQMEVLNAVLEDWSRQILEDPYPTHGDDQLESILTELPLELQNLDLQPLQTYLEATGVVAHSFRQRLLQEEAERGPASSDNEGGSNGSSSSSSSILEGEIPARFFQTDFDLTDPETFRELLLMDGKQDDDNNNGTAMASVDEVSDNKEKVIDIDGLVHAWFPLPPREAFGSFLDTVELALLQQVRTKSGAFFEESLRFAQLQEWIQSLLQQVVQLEAGMRHLQQDLLEPMEIVPASDSRRADLQNLLNVLERTSEMLRCKSSIGGFLSAQDDLTAIEQIQYGRRLLSGRQPDNEDSEEGVELNRLLALKSVSQQLGQYEELVVTNLRDELVEIFLGWNTAAVSSIYAVNGSSTTPSKSSQQVQQRVREIVGALSKCRALSQTREAYGNRLQDVIRMTVRTTVGEFASDAGSEGTAVASISGGATAMTLDRFLDCLDMLFEQLRSLLTSASGVDGFCVEEHISFEDCDAENDTTEDQMKISRTASGLSSSDSLPDRATPLSSVVAAAAELSSKSVSELLRLRKEAHSLVTLDEMIRIWDKCMSFTMQVEDLSGHKASALRSTLLAQAKAFVERKHESNMSALVAALDSERWAQCEVSVERQDALTRLCSGRYVRPTTGSKDTEDAVAGTQKNPEAEVEGIRYKVVWSCLLLVEMIMTNIAASAHFSSIASNVVAKVAELLRLFNSRTTQLVLGAGAIHSAARLKSINAKHLSLVTQCLGMVIAILPHVRAALMAQMPAKQYTLLSSLDHIKKEYADHNEKVLNKFVTIIGGIVEHGLAPKIPGTDFDARAKASPPIDGKVPCCVFLEGVSTNTRKMHQVLASLLPPDHLQDVFSKIFAFVDQKVPALFIGAAEQKPASPARGSSPLNASRKVLAAFVFPQTDEGKRRFLMEVEIMTKNLNGLEGVCPWDFTVVSVLAKHVEYDLNNATMDGPSVEEKPPAEEDSKAKAQTTPETTKDSEAKAEPTNETVVDEGAAEVNSSTEAEPVGESDQPGQAPEGNSGAEKELTRDTDITTVNGEVDGDRANGRNSPLRIARDSESHETDAAISGNSSHAANGAKVNENTEPLVMGIDSPESDGRHRRSQQDPIDSNKDESLAAHLS